MTGTRRRRTPEQARQEILDAATDLIAQHGPDAVGLRQVAEAAGVSHALISHYFGTYKALVRAVLQREHDRQRQRIRDRIGADGGVPYADAMTQILFEAVADERYIRLFAWSSLNGEDSGSTSTALAQLVDSIESGIRLVRPGSRQPDRARIEQTVLIALSASYGYALGRRPWLTGLGHDPNDRAQETAFRATLSAMLARHLADTELDR
ncbi:TetR/AcrR family transcriptional regulator [Actinoplanes sp. N902-109]|uniref:TetR/AcrR family transcriptional regulator n=1 Tax=Actinoplanes sp. (strain N902-109) TaxID=649831 RepID=UPI00032963FB|nr:TetR/AcrR family transcriptional regulator [Actinoplanes sp. N902-109]AGL16050.1 TetR family transcriptional regulator [Actinoplanes sp. N902-109]